MADGHASFFDIAADRPQCPSGRLSFLCPAGKLGTERFPEIAEDAQTSEYEDRKAPETAILVGFRGIIFWCNVIRRPKSSGRRIHSDRWPMQRVRGVADNDESGGSASERLAGGTGDQPGKLHH